MGNLSDFRIAMAVIAVICVAAGFGIGLLIG
jgi:hypothetical protein